MTPPTASRPDIATPDRTISVIQGEVHISADPEAVLSTILGSCVAVCMWDPVAGVGGMNHFLLPTQAGRKGETVKYGAHAMELLINGLLRKGASRDTLVCKLFGGASMARHSSGIGQSNITFAKSYLRDEGIPIEAESIGGNEARRVRFWATTGRAKLLIVPRIDDDPELKPTVVTPRQPPQEPDITLF